MSDYNPFFEEGGTSPLEGSPADQGGVAAGDGQPTDQPVIEEPRDYLDLDRDSDRYVRVKVDGEDVEVPLKEALQGYSRTADYTRKTQELATQRQQAEYALTLQRALQARPAETIRLLASEYGIDQQPPSSPPPPHEPWEQPFDDDTAYVDPLERRINQQQQMLNQLAEREQRREADSQLRLAIGGLQRKYDLDESTSREVVGRALQAGMGPAQFEMIYQSLAFERAQAARAQAQADRQERDVQREAAKMVGQQLVASGGSANGAGGPMPGAASGNLSIREAFEAAERELGTRL